MNHLGDPFCVREGCAFASFLSASLFSLMVIKPCFWRRLLGMINHDAGWNEQRPQFSFILSGFCFIYVFLRNWSLDSLIDWKNNWEKDPTIFPPSRDTQAISLETYMVRKFALLSLVLLFCGNHCKGRIQRGELTPAFTCDSLGVKWDCCQVIQTGTQEAERLMQLMLQSSCQCSLQWMHTCIPQAWSVAAWRWSGARINGNTGGTTNMGQQPCLSACCHTAQHRASQVLKTAERYLSHLLLDFNFPSSFKPHLPFLDLWAQTHPPVIKILSSVYTE